MIKHESTIFITLFISKFIISLNAVTQIPIISDNNVLIWELITRDGRTTHTSLIPMNYWLLRQSPVVLPYFSHPCLVAFTASGATTSFIWIIVIKIRPVTFDKIGSMRRTNTISKETKKQEPAWLNLSKDREDWTQCGRQIATLEQTWDQKLNFNRYPKLGPMGAWPGGFRTILLFG